MSTGLLLESLSSHSLSFDSIFITGVSSKRDSKALRVKIIRDKNNKQRLGCTHFHYPFSVPFPSSPSFSSEESHEKG
jgi:hypothetical protein